ncbi:hypothetical protein Bbelb_109960 [Branchiostoma belcheri]|nr:hypothetical protein Bbelb_109960 [Branchiostoma belcheri]
MEGLPENFELKKPGETERKKLQLILECREQISVKRVVTDGEWNSLRTMGGDRPVFIIQLMMEAKGEARALTRELSASNYTKKDAADWYHLNYYRKRSKNAGMYVSGNTRGSCSRKGRHD